MNKNLRSLVEKATAVDCGNYYLRCSELIELAEQCNNNFIEGSYILFKIGFFKRTEIGKSKAKKRKSEKRWCRNGSFY